MAKTQICAAFSTYWVSFKGDKASAEGASETVRDLFTKTAYDVIILKIPGGAMAPLPHARATWIIAFL